MALSNAEKQRRWRARQRDLVRAGKDARLLEGSCVICLMERGDLEEEGRVIANIGNGRVLLCDQCLGKALADLRRQQARREHRLERVEHRLARVAKRREASSSARSLK